MWCLPLIEIKFQYTNEAGEDLKIHKNAQILHGLFYIIDAKIQQKMYKYVFVHFRSIYDSRYYFNIKSTCTFNVHILNVLLIEAFGRSGWFFNYLHVKTYKNSLYFDKTECYIHLYIHIHW